MKYELSELLDMVQQEGGVAVYLVPGMPPIFAMRVKPIDPSVPSVMLFPIEGPVLTSDDTRSLLKSLESEGYGGGSGYAKLGNFRYRKGKYDFDVFVFDSTDGMQIEFRVPYVDEC